MARVPSNWKDAGASEEQLTYVIYDGQLTTTSANVALVLFDNTEASVGLDQCNMQIANSLTSNQRFLLKKISVHFNDVVSSADTENILDRASFELVVNNSRKLACPLREVMSEKTIIPSGVTQDEQYFMGGTYELDNFIMIKGGDYFVVNIETGETAPGASTELTVCLHGDLVRPI